MRETMHAPCGLPSYWPTASYRSVSSLSLSLSLSQRADAGANEVFESRRMTEGDSSRARQPESA